MLLRNVLHLNCGGKEGWFFEWVPINCDGVVADILNMLYSTLLRHVVRLCIDDSLFAAWLSLVPELPGVELVLRVLRVPEDKHHHTLDTCHVALERLCRVLSILKCYPIKLTL